MKHTAEEFTPDELHQLDRLAASLREACPDPSLSSGFHHALSTRLRRGWSFRSALEQNLLIRVAAGLLMVSMVAAPVAALVSLLRNPEPDRLVLGFTALPEYSDQELSSRGEVEGAGTSIIGPIDEFDLPLVPWSPPRLEALEQANRLAQAGASWRASGDGGPTFPASGDLWTRFLAACAQGDTTVPDAELQAQVQRLAVEARRDDGSRTALAAWRWVLTGETTAIAEAPLAWEGAPFLRE